MDIAVLGDIHGNYEAFETCIKFFLDRNINQFIFLGDYVGELAFPQRTMDLIYQLKETYHCIFIKGNKEDYWLNYRTNKMPEWKAYDSTTGSLFYTYENLREMDIEFFTSLEHTKVIQYTDMTPITICHGSPYGINEKLIPESKRIEEMIEQCYTDIILCAHTHVQRAFEHKGKRILNPGSVGVPLNSEGMTQCMILHGEENGWREEFIRLSYDVENEINNLQIASLHRIAPYWCRITEHLLRRGTHSHGEVLERAMKYCREEEGTCMWPNIPEKYWEKGYEDIIGSSIV